MLWLQSGGCGGCSMSLLGAESPGLLLALEAAGIELLWHPSLSEQTGDEFIRLLEDIERGDKRLDILCLEGAVMRGPAGTGRFHMMSGTDRPVMAWIEALANKAQFVMAIGSCAAFGGISAAGANETEACGLSFDGETGGGLLGEEFRSGAGMPVINIAGCPVHPGWITETLQCMASGAFGEDDLDEWGRPLLYSKFLVHHGCARNEFYEFKASAERLCDQGCMMEHLGCKGTQARADCNIRAWNGSGSCLSGSYPCINCTAPGFEEPGHPFLSTPKISGIPIGLPADMPKAWFVALASLSKAATPDRLKKNAVSDRITTLPKNGRKERL